MSGKRVLVTGGSGFIPSHLVERLMQDGCEDPYGGSMGSWLLTEESTHIDDGMIVKLGSTLLKVEVFDSWCKPAYLSAVTAACRPFQRIEYHPLVSH